MKKSYRKGSLKVKVVLLFLLMALLVNFAMLCISFVSYSNTIKDESKRIGAGIANTIASGINGNRIVDWSIERRMEEYEETEAELENIIKSHSSISRILVAKMESDGMLVIYNMNRALRNSSFLSTIPYDEATDAIKDELLDGYAVEPVEYQDKRGSFLKVFAPVKTNLGEVACYVVCEISVNNLDAERKAFMGKLLIVMAVAAIVVGIAYLYLRKRLLSPMHRISAALQQFAEDNSLGETVKTAISDKSNNCLGEIKRLTDSFVLLIDDVNNRSVRVEELGDDIIKNMSEMVKIRSVDESEHFEAVGEYTGIILDNLLHKPKFKKQITPAIADAILDAVPMYDLGEISVSNEILNKSGKLTEEEFEAIKNHTQSGIELIDEVMRDYQDETHIEIAKQMAGFHHERWDGSGYPMHLRGKKIPLPARIIAVPDVFNALVSNKTYRRGKSIDEALEIIKQGRGKQFDKDIVDAFLAGESSVRRIARKYANE